MNEEKTKSLYECKVEYLKENGFTGHIKNVDYHYRRVFNSRRGCGAWGRYLKQFKVEDKKSYNAG